MSALFFRLAFTYFCSFVFVLDVSASMAARNGQRLQRATRELIGSINQLNDQQNFSVILYSNHALPMFVNNNEAVIVRRRRALIALPNALYALILFLVCGENNNENIYPFQWCVEK